MISRHRKMALDEAVAGIALTQDVPDGKGGVYLPRGTVLTEALLGVLRRRGIDAIFVFNDAVSEEELRDERERVEQRVGRLFRKCRGERAADALFTSVLQYRMEGLT